MKHVTDGNVCWCKPMVAEYGRGKWVVVRGMWHEITATGKMKNRRTPIDKRRKKIGG